MKDNSQWPDGDSRSSWPVIARPLPIHRLANRPLAEIRRGALALAEPGAWSLEHGLAWAGWTLKVLVSIQMDQ